MINWLTLLLLSSACSSGCATANKANPVSDDTLKALLRDAPLNAYARDWVVKEFGDAQGDCLSTLYTSTEWNTLTLRVRRLEGDCVRCVESCMHGTGVDRRNVYVICDPEAIAMWKALYDQCAAGHRFRSTRREGASDQGGAYAFVTGSANHITIDEKSHPGPIINAIYEYRNRKIVGEEKDFDPSLVFFDRNAFPSFATYVMLAIGWLDDLCEVKK